MDNGFLDTVLANFTNAISGNWGPQHFPVVCRNKPIHGDPFHRTFKSRDFLRSHSSFSALQLNQSNVQQIGVFPVQPVGDCIDDAGSQHYRLAFKECHFQPFPSQCDWRATLLAASAAWLFVLAFTHCTFLLLCEQPPGAYVCGPLSAPL